MTTVELFALIDATLADTSEATPAETEYRDWLNRGHSRRVAAWTVYMNHLELKPEWLEAHS